MKGNNTNMILKIDLEKAIDRLKWSFIKFTPSFFYFLAKLSQLIFSCISTSTISILVNNSSIESFQPHRAMNQIREPLSPYLFIFCIEILSRKIDQDFPISICRTGPKISHPFFVYDLTLFARANEKDCDTISSILNAFNYAFGQKIKFVKSKIIFSSNCCNGNANDCSNYLGIKASTRFGGIWASLSSTKDPLMVIFSS